MSTQLLPRSAPLPWTRRLACSQLGAFSLLIAACDPFLVSACRFDDNLPGCPRPQSSPSDAGSNSPDMATPKLDEPAPLGPLRKFERRASVSFGTSRRFVGLQGSPRQAVFLATNGTNKWWDLAKLDLNHPTESSRLIVGQTCSTADCPPIPATIDFAADRIYRTGAGYYYFDYKTMKRVKSLPSNLEQADCELGTLAVRPFVSAQYDAFMLVMVGPFQMYARYGAMKYINIQDDTRAASLFVIGDLDSFDHRENDLEAIAFSAGDAFFINRSSDRKDPSVIVSINAAIQKGSSGVGGAIQAAYIDDINNDQLSDLIFVRGGKIRAVSYRGTDRQGFPHEFGDWMEDVAPVISGETVQYIVVDELTQDSYQDLIVETDKNVHFYRNVAK